MRRGAAFKPKCQGDGPRGSAWRRAERLNIRSGCSTEPGTNGIDRICAWKIEPANKVLICRVKRGRRFHEAERMSTRYRIERALDRFLLPPME
jgi:hypothetical protein